MSIPPLDLAVFACALSVWHKYYKWKQRGGDKASLCRDPCFIRGSSAPRLKDAWVRAARGSWSRPRISFMKIPNTLWETLKNAVQWSEGRLRRGHCPRKYDSTATVSRETFKRYNSRLHPRKREEKMKTRGRVASLRANATSFVMNLQSEMISHPGFRDVFDRLFTFIP